MILNALLLLLLSVALPLSIFEAQRECACGLDMDGKDSLKRKRSSRSAQSGKVQSLHAKNPYRNSPPDFAALALRHPEILGAYVQVNPVTNKGHIDFTQNDALRALTKALLLKDFEVNVEIPADHLCPPLPNRLNYLCWISDLLEHSTSQAHTKPPLVLDIGVGPVCIYPTLGNKVFGWNFVGSDIDAASVAASQQTIDANPALQGHIRVIHVRNSDTLQEQIRSKILPKMAQRISAGSEADTAASDSSASLRDNVMRSLYPQEGTALRGPVCTALHAMGGTHAQTLSQCEQHTTTGASAVGTGAVDRLFDVVMTNPPFYDADEQIQASEHTVCTGSTSEMRTLGGEVAFVAAIIYDSLLLKDRVLWYTAMVGKHSSLRPLTHLLTTSGVPRAHLFVTTLAQGLTHRWALAWTFSPGAAAAYKAFCVQSDAQAAAAAVTEADRGVDDISNDGTDIGTSTGTGKRSKVGAPAIVHSFTTTVRCSALASTMTPSDSTVLSTPMYKPYFAGAAYCSVNTDMIARVVAAIEDTNATLGATQSNHSGNNTNIVYVHKLSEVQHNTSDTTLHYQVVSTTAASVVAHCIQYTIPQVDVASPVATDTITIIAGIHGVTGHCEKWREQAVKFHEMFEANLLRTNRRWRRQLASKTSEL